MSPNLQFLFLTHNHTWPIIKQHKERLCNVVNIKGGNDLTSKLVHLLSVSMSTLTLLKDYDC